MTLTKQSATKAGRSKQAKARKQLTPDEMFFYEHAGHSFDPKKETSEQGRIRCAIALAESERQAKNLGWYVSWSDDWSCNHQKEFDYTPSNCQSASLWDEDGIHCLASLGCIDDADENYRRVIEAELASEGMYEFDKEIETLDAH